MNNPVLTTEQMRADFVLKIHGIGNEQESLRGGARPKGKIDAIIQDVRAANAEAEAVSE